MKTILHSVHIHAPPGKVYRALTTREGLSGWWTRGVAVDEREEGIIDFTFHGDFHPNMRQTTLSANRLVEWKCISGHDNWLENTFSFELSDRDGETLLMIRQHYARQLPDEVYGTYNFNWGYYLWSLKQLCEKGQGMPFDPSHGGT